ncbi:LAQU0S03e07404g1_1 [Lachancea quebecensis]|uniref:LAQU0S03e07404g1_1 n=1 Tax=Lachancea quebecensis TaxID=1654605 RepID=A0A0P1KP66_9SACH|nr:LAQU0S03e07404g1_1 [Lachancea quebecensis]
MTDSRAPSDISADTADQRKRKRASRESSLSEDQKRQNHVSSEQRRRQAMRQTYDTLVDIVPDLTSAQSRSELQIYAKSMIIAFSATLETSQVLTRAFWFRLQLSSLALRTKPRSARAVRTENWLQCSAALGMGNAPIDIA